MLCVSLFWWHLSVHCDVSDRCGVHLVCFPPSGTSTSSLENEVPPECLFDEAYVGNHFSRALWSCHGWPGWGQLVLERDFYRLDKAGLSALFFSAEAQFNPHGNSEIDAPVFPDLASPCVRTPVHAAAVVRCVPLTLLWLACCWPPRPAVARICEKVSVQQKLPWVALSSHKSRKILDFFPSHLVSENFH